MSENENVNASTNTETEEFEALMNLLGAAMFGTDTAPQIEVLESEGDIVAFNGESGQVEQIHLRIMELVFSGVTVDAKFFVDRGDGSEMVEAVFPPDDTEKMIREVQAQRAALAQEQHSQVTQELVTPDSASQVDVNHG